MRVRLGVLAVLSLAFMTLILALLLRHLEALSRNTVMQATEQVLSQTAAHLESSVREFLQPAPEALADLRRTYSLHLSCDQEKDFFRTLHRYRRLSELTFTPAADQDGEAQLSVFRDHEGTLVSQRIVAKGGKYWRMERRRPSDRAYSEEPWRQLGETTDPRQHPTFTTPRELFEEGERAPVWSDLSYSQLDAQLPEGQRRIGVTVQGPVENGAGKLAGIARVGLTTGDVDHAFDGVAELHSIAFLCDARGRLITPVLPKQGKSTVIEDDGDLRVRLESPPPVVTRILAKVPQTSANTTSLLLEEADGERFLACLRPLNLENTQDWRVALILPESVIAGKLLALRTQLLTSAGLGLLLIILATAALLALLRSELSQLSVTARRMRDFDFRATPVGGVIQDLAELGSSLEAAKKTLRAMVKYVPVELVRQLFEARLEPVLSSEPRVVTLMFTDIEGFTSLAERLAPAELSKLLGDYLSAMNRVIQSHQGTVLERVGDALLSLWNAPTPVEEMEARACRCALECCRAIHGLERSELLRTRFGLHRDRVLVGHFGSSDRLNYGVLGDGVNLASRLEGLNKVYGTQILISQTVREYLKSDFIVRKLDLVAVKGKQQGIEIFELVGSAGEVDEAPLRRYEEAWDLYRTGRFREAAELLQSQPEDRPSAVLLERCRAYAEHPPAADWDGVYVAKSK